MQYLEKMKKDNPPAKSPLMKILQDTMKKPTGEEEEDGEEGAEQLNLDSIGCTANVVVID